MKNSDNIIGKSAVAETVVSTENIAKTVGSGSLEVFATPMLIALIEKAACECLAEFLENGETSVGTAVNIEHTAASAVGTKITATASVTNGDGRKIDFSVVASDEQGEIGKGTHARFIVNSERFINKANERRNK